MQTYIYLTVILCFIVIFIIFKHIRVIKYKRSPSFITNSEEVEKFLQIINNSRKDYFTYTLKEELKRDYENVYKFFCERLYSNIKNSSIFEFKSIYIDLDSLVKQWNEEFVKNELERNKDILDNVDGKSLDKQQRRAVVVDESNNLVLAGAGSGKTLTISAKVKYLINRKDVSPEEILLISFTKKAAEEMTQRISEKLSIDIEAKTFHKLGLEVITKHRNLRPDISEDLERVIESYFNENIINNRNDIQSIITFFGYYLNIPKDLEEFENLGECHNFYRNVDFETIKCKVQKGNEINKKINELKIKKETLHGETVKSLEELMIANFLFLNGINYVYEYKYPFESEDKYRKHYRPDFYLTDFDIYIEHFGITKDNRTPWLSKVEEKKYIDGIGWKRNLHSKNQTTLVETYSYYNKQGILLVKLEEKLKQLNVEFKEPDYKEIYNKVFGNSKEAYFSEFKKLISSFIGLFKSNGFSLEGFDSLKDKIIKIENTFLRQRSNLFLEIVKPIYAKYEAFLKDNGMIDFNDMINEATEIVKQNNIPFKYKYIIIDEYQDISLSRFNLIREIRNKTKAKIMCVGDDWQSIYRFTGSDIDLFTSFEKYLGYYELLKIESTYRNSQELIDIAGSFIMKNKKQLKKNLKSNKHNDGPIRIVTYDKEISYAIAKAIEEIVEHFGTEAKITILGRNNFDIDILQNEEKDINKDFKVTKSKEQILVKYNRYPKVNINYLTVHRSKGLEADNVIIINLENKLVGFPNKISDDPILSLVLTDIENFEFAEERRLFYVALTRTKNITYLITPTQRQSVFCEELIKEFKINSQHTNQSQSNAKNCSCPRCQKGYLVVKENTANNSKFIGCSNYPFCDVTFKELEIINNNIVCDNCGGFLVKRKGAYGQFYGCVNYPYCNHTVEINSTR